MYYREGVTIAVAPGTYDPITLGHVDVIERASAIFDELIVGVAKNSSKFPLLDLRARMALATASVAHLPNVSVQAVPGLLVDFCHQVGAKVIVKGIRGSSDYDGEIPMALMNRHLTDVETVFLPARPEVAHIASSLVKDVMRFGGQVEDLVTPAVYQAMVEAMTKGNLYLGSATPHTDSEPTAPTRLRLIDSSTDNESSKERNE